MSKKIIPLFFFLLALSSCKNPLGDLDPVSNTFCAGETDPTIDEECNALSEILSWDFSKASDYTYNPNFIEISNGSAKLKTVDQTHSGDDFSDGTHIGTYYDAGVLKPQVSSYAEHDASWTPEYSNLVAYFKFNSSWANEIGTGDLVPTGDATFTDSRKIGAEAAIFDGDGDKAVATLTGAAALNFDDDYSISYWLAVDEIFDNPSDALFRPITLNCPGGYLLHIWVNDLANSVAGTMRNLSYDGSSAYATNLGVLSEQGFKHYIHIKKDDTLNTYIDGNLIDSSPAPFAETGASCSQLQFGDSNFKGVIDDVAIWNKAIGSNDVLNIYNRQANSYADDTSLNSSWTPRWNDIVGYWKMDGNWLDSSGMGNHGVAKEDATFSIEAKIGERSGSFDGNDDYAEIPNHDSLEPSEITILAWVKPNAANNGNIISNTGNSGYRLRLAGPTGSRIGFHDRGATNWLNSNTDIPLDTWSQVGVVANANGIFLYINGQLDRSGGIAYGAPSTTGKTTIGIYAGGSVEPFSGEIDDVAIWRASLTPQDIKYIYNRQKQKYASHYDSPIIDLRASGAWTKLEVQTPLPYGKELLGQSQELSSDYASLSGALSVGLVGYWNFDEAAVNTIAGSDFKDHSSTGAHADESGGVKLGAQLITGNAVNLDGNDDFIQIPSATAPSPNDSISISIWMKARATQDYAQVISKLTPGIGWQIQRRVATELLHIRVDTSAGFNQFEASNAKVFDGKIHHILLTLDSGQAKLYIDGGLDKSWAYSHGTGFSSVGSDIVIGGSGIPLKGIIDDTAIWSRALTSNEVQQLYRRGANRLKYQVKSCVDSLCHCKAFNTSPLGSTDDCDGDSIPNNSDTDDVYRAEFIGPGGNGSTHYSELFNRAPGDLSFSCSNNTSDSDNNICMNDEINVSGSPRAGSPSFTFSNMAASAVVPDNRYFQYRVIMEAEENTACDGKPCLPELTSVEVGPTGRYYAGSPVVTSNTPINYEDLDSISISEGGTCSLSYQLSPDGSNYYYHDGSQWVTASGEDLNQSTQSSILTSNVDSFIDTVGPGNLFFKAFMTSDTSQSCSINEIEVMKPN